MGVGGRDSWSGWADSGWVATETGNAQLTHFQTHPGKICRSGRPHHSDLCFESACFVAKLLGQPRDSFRRAVYRNDVKIVWCCFLGHFPTTRNLLPSITPSETPLRSVWPAPSPNSQGKAGELSLLPGDPLGPPNTSSVPALKTCVVRRHQR